MPPRIKCSANYQNGRLATLEAKANGYDGALLLNTRGKLAEAPGACCFMVRGGVPVTPPVTADILESVTRATLLELFRTELGQAPVERDIDRTELYLADEVFLCGSGWEITPVRLDRPAAARGRRPARPADAGDPGVLLRGGPGREAGLPPLAHAGLRALRPPPGARGPAVARGPATAPGEIPVVSVCDMSPAATPSTGRSRGGSTSSCPIWP